MAIDKKTVYGIHRTSKESLVEYVNLANNTNLTVEELIFSTPSEIAGTWREDATDKNTIIRLTAKEESDYRESALIVYDRLDLAKFNQLFTEPRPFKVLAYQPATTHDLIKPIFIRYGIFLDKEDIVDEPLSNLETDPQLTPRYKLKAKTDAIGWIGECDIIVGEGNAILADYLNQPSLPGLNYPVDGDGAEGSAIVYMYGLDFTPVKDVLETYPEEMVLDEFSTDLLDAIKQVDINEGKDLWNLDPVNTEWSLHGAEVVYNGVNDSALPTNQSYKYVMGIQLRTDVTRPPGTMYLHYNEPFDPDLVVQP